MKKEFYIYLFIIAISTFSFSVMAMEEAKAVLLRSEDSENKELEILSTGQNQEEEKADEPSQFPQEEDLSAKQKTKNRYRGYLEKKHQKRLKIFKKTNYPAYHALVNSRPRSSDQESNEDSIIYGAIFTKNHKDEAKLDQELQKKYEQLAEKPLSSAENLDPDLASSSKPTWTPEFPNIPLHISQEFNDIFALIPSVMSHDKDEQYLSTQFNYNRSDILKQLMANAAIFKQEELFMNKKNELFFTSQYQLSLMRQAAERAYIALGELAVMSFWKNAVEPTLALGARTIYENITESGRKYKVDRQYIENQTEIKMAAAFIAETTGQIKFEQQQERNIKNSLDKYSIKLRKATDTNKKERYRKKIEEHALTMIKSRDARKQSALSNELLIAEIRNRNKYANDLIQKRYRNSSIKPSKDKKERAQKIAQQYLEQKPPEAVDVDQLNIESPLIDNEELIS